MQPTTLMNLSVALLSVVCAAHAYADGARKDDAGPVRAMATIASCDSANVSGTARLVERHSDEGVKLVQIKLRVKGLADGKHAVHIHQTGQCQPCGAAGGHFDPGLNGNASPDGNHPYHLGDLVNLEVKRGVGRLSTSTTRVTLSTGPLSLFDVDGSAFIVHVNPDTYCPNGAEAGCAGGARAACGIIELAPDDDDADDWFD